MTDFELAKRLFPKASEIVAEALGDSMPPSFVEAEAVEDSASGIVKVRFLGDTVLLGDDAEGTADDAADTDATYEEWDVVEVPCSATIKAGERVLVTVQDNAPVDAVVSGWGDRVATTASNAEAIATATDQHFWSDGNGIHVSTDDHDAAGTNNILINSLGILLRELTTVLLELSSAGVIVGDQSGTHLSASSSAVEIISGALQTLLSMSKQTRNIDGTNTDLGAITSTMPLLLEHVATGTSRLYMTNGTSPNKELLRIVEALGNYTAEVEASANASLGAESKMTATSTQGGMKVAQVSASAASSGSLINLSADEILVGFAPLFTTATTTKSIGNVNAGAGWTCTETATTVAGYTPMAIIGFNQTHNQAGTVGGVNRNGTTLGAYGKNTSSTAWTGTNEFTWQVLYIKSELL